MIDEFRALGACCADLVGCTGQPTSAACRATAIASPISRPCRLFLCLTRDYQFGATAGTERTPFSGSVEADETFIGGKVRGYRSNKTARLGAIRRGGKVYFEVSPRTDREMLHAFIRQHTADGAEVIYTDEERATTALRARIAVANR